MKTKEAYRDFMNRANVPVQMCDWWLDAVCGENEWNVLLTSNLSTAYIYYKKKKFGSSIIEHPLLTTYTGLWTESSILKEEDIKELSLQMPKSGICIQKLHWKLKGLSLIEKLGFKQTTRYTHLLNLENSLEEIYEAFKGSLKTIIKKGEKHLQIEESDDLSLAYELIHHSFKRQSMAVPFSYEIFNRLDQALIKKDARKILIAKDEEGNPHSCIYMVFYKGIASYIIGGTDPSFKKSNSQSLALWKAIQIAKTKECKIFDFTGSVMPGIEKFFMAYNGKKTAIPVIYKTKNRFFEMYMNWKNFV